MTQVARTPAAPLRAIVETLVAGGVRDVVICPGSRSTPMALAILGFYGYEGVLSLKGGFGGWAEAGYPVVEYAVP